MTFHLRPRLAPVLLALGLGGSLALGGCAGRTPYDNLRAAKPTGSAFSRALYADYASLARSLGIENAPSSTAFDKNAAFSIGSVDSSVAEVANAYATKALNAAEGKEPLPEAAPTDDQNAEVVRIRMLRALDNGRTKAPAQAARTQANFDCWVLDATVPELMASARACHQAFLSSLARLERMPGVAQTAAPKAAPTTPVESGTPDQTLE